MGFLDKTVTTELDNGVRLCYLHRKGTPVEMQFHIMTGSIHEGKFLGCGISHFLEHMLFQGCAGFPERAVAEKVNQLGGDVNAYTTYDHTCYRMQLARQHWREQIKMLSSMVRFPELPKERFLAEREVILREYERGSDNLSRQLHEKFMRTMFMEHPLRYPVIGCREMIAEVTRDMAWEYHQLRYTPERCVVVAVGDLDYSGLLECAGEYLGDWKRSELAPVSLPDEDLPMAVRHGEIIFSDPLERIYYGMRGPAPGNPELPALELLSGVLGAGENSILNRNLVLDKPLGIGVRSFHYFIKGMSFTGITGKAEPGKMARFQSALLKELEKAASGKISAAQVEREKGLLYADHLREFRDPVNIAAEIGGGMRFDNNPAVSEIYLNDLQRTSVEQVRKAAEKYLDLSHWVCIHQHCRHKMVKNSSSESSVRLEKFFADSGTPVIYAPDNQLPLCNFFMVFSGGALFEPAGCAGMSRVLAAVLTAGGGKLSEGTLLKKLDEAGVELDVSAGANSITIEFSVPSRKMNRAVAVIAEMLGDPRFEDEAVHRDIIRIVESIKERDYNPLLRGADMACRTLYSEHPYACARSGKIEDIIRFDRGMIRDFYRRCCAGKRIMGFAGDCSKTDVLKWSEILDRAMVSPALPLTIPAEPVFPPDKKMLQCFLEREQTVVLRVIPGVDSAASDDLDLLEILNHAENGLASTLFKTVREDNALCYSVGMSFAAGFHPGTISFYAMTAPGAGDEVMGLFNSEIKRLFATGLTQDEFDSARRNLLFDIDRTLESADLLLRSAVMDAYYGRDLLEQQRRREKIQTLTLEEFNRQIAGFFDEPAGVEVLVLPEEKK